MYLVEKPTWLRSTTEVGKKLRTEGVIRMPYHRLGEVEIHLEGTFLREEKTQYEVGVKIVMIYGEIGSQFKTNTYEWTYKNKDTEIIEYEVSDGEEDTWEKGNSSPFRYSPE
jgi:hypothetical protein